MSNGDDDIPSWVQWLAGGLVAGWVVFWQWMERKVDRLNDRIDKLRDDTRKDRHDLATSVQRQYQGVDDKITELRERVTRGENRPGGSGKQ